MTYSHTRLKWIIPLIFKALLINLNLSNESNIEALNAHETRDVETLYHILKEFPLRDLFAPYKLIKSVMLLESCINDILNGLPKHISHRYYIQDLLESLSPIYNLDPTNSEINKESCKEKIYELLTSLKSDPVKLIRYLLVWMGFNVSSIHAELGGNDPISESMTQIFCVPKIEELLNKYLNDVQLVDNITKKINTFVNQIMGRTPDIVNIDNENPKKSESSKRLTFPTRISRNRNMDSGIKEEILKRLFAEFGSNFENIDGQSITLDEFKFLFGGGTRPAYYNTPYYWNQSDKQFAGLLRLLYFAQDTGINEIVLLIDDKGKEKSSVKWSARKQGLGKRTLKPIEDSIQKIVKEVTGERLPDIDLTKLNKPKKSNNQNDECEY